jgi:hypothetical protein
MLHSRLLSVDVHDNDAPFLIGYLIRHQYWYYINVDQFVELEFQEES